MEKTEKAKRTRVIVAITGASGAIYGVRLIEALLADPAREVHLVVSPAGEQVMAAELGPPLRPEGTELELPGIMGYFNLTVDQAERLIQHEDDDIGAPPASGTFRAAATIVCPCSMKTVGHIAAGTADNLIVRAADVALKEGRPLVLVPRETPFSLIHLRNLTRLAEAGAVILPAMPAFYQHPRDIEDLVRHIVQKIFDRLDWEFPGAFRWGEKP